MKNTITVSTTYTLIQNIYSTACKKKGKILSGAAC
jgi:hypothetical protein